MSASSSDRIEDNSSEVPEVLRTLAGVLPQFTGADLEAQLQTYDTFLGLLNPSVRPRIADLLREAAAKTTVPESRARIEVAADAVERGECVAQAYDHDKAMKAYQEPFRKRYPVPVEAPKAETPPSGKRTHPQILTQLDRIEAEMKRIGYWSANPPDLSHIESYLDAPTFELWLQVIFLRKARIAAENDALPKGSQVGEMARRQYDYMEINDNAATLLHLLQDFDELVIAAA